MGASDVRAGGAYVEIGGKDAQLATALAGAKKKMQAFGQWAEATGRRMMIAGTAMLAPIVGSTIAFTKYGDTVAKTARRTGFATEAISELGYAAEISGSSLDAIEKGAKRMARAVYDAGRGLAETQDALGMLNLSYDQLKDLSPEDQFMKIGGAIGDLADPTMKAALAQVLFGRAGTELIPLFDQGAAGMDRLRARARELGISIGPEAAGQAEWMQDALTDLKKSILGMAIAVGQVVVPIMERWLPVVIKHVQTFRDWVKANGETIKTFMKVAAAVLIIGAALLILGKIIGVVMFLLSPAGAVMLAIAGLIALLEAIGVVNLGFTDFVGSIRIGGVKISTWFTALGIILLKVWARVTNWISEAWDRVVLFIQDTGGVIYRAWWQVAQWIYDAVMWVVVKAAEAFNWLAEKANAILPEALELPTINIDSIVAAAEAGSQVYDDKMAASEAARDKRHAEYAKAREAREKALAQEISDLNAANAQAFADDAKEKAEEAAKSAIPEFKMGGGGIGLDMGDLGQTKKAGEVIGTFSGRLASQMLPKTEGVQEEQLGALKGILEAVSETAKNTKVTPAGQFAA